MSTNPWKEWQPRVVCVASDQDIGLNDRMRGVRRNLTVDLHILGHGQCLSSASYKVFGKWRE